MNFDEAARLVRTHVEGQFPKRCSSCGRIFPTLADYLRSTRHAGAPFSYDAANDDWAPRKPLGTISIANCSCGTSIAIGSDGMSLVTIWRLMRWARTEIKHRGIGMEALLNEVRDAVDRAALAAADAQSRTYRTSEAPKM